MAERKQENNPGFNDLNTNGAVISNDTAIVQNNRSRSENLTEDLAAPLIGDGGPPSPHDTKRRVCKAVLLLVILCVAGGAFVAGRYCTKGRQCAHLNPPANGGHVHCSMGNNKGSKCSFSCPEGYLLKRPNGSAAPSPNDLDVTCQSDQISNYLWSGDEPYCERVVSCASPTNDTNVKLECVPPYSTNSKSESESPKEQTYSNGTTCSFSCPPETSLDSNQTIANCLNTGKWNTTAAISCINGCSFFAHPPNSNCNCTKDRLYDSKCLFSCEENFVLVGPSIMVCQSDVHKGRWTSNPPRCECPVCRSGQKCEDIKDFTTTWDQINSSSSMNTRYDGREIICKEVKRFVHRKKSPESLVYGCQCWDKTTNVIKQCNDGGSMSEACRKAYASVLLLLSYEGFCNLPCDAEDMPAMC